MFWNIILSVFLGLVLLICFCGLLWMPFAVIDIATDFKLSDALGRKRDAAFAKWKAKPLVRPKTEKTEAYREGYKDMAEALECEQWRRLEHKGYRGYGMGMGGYAFDFDGAMPWARDSTLRAIAKKKDVVRNFDPSRGRTSDEYIRGDGKDWEAYYQGGMKFLADVDDMQARMMEEERVLDIRKSGVAQLDKQYIASKRELDKLRDKTFAKVDDHQAFEKAMLETTKETRNA